jgi:hypothetical protein
MSWVCDAPRSEKEDLPMKLIVVLLVTLTVLCAGQSVRSSLSDASSVRGDTQTIIYPRVERVRLKGNKLIVTGQSFSDGATIVINNQEVATRNDSESPTTRLIAKKGGKKIPFDEIFDLSVEDADGEPLGGIRGYFRSPSFLAPVLPAWPYPFSANLQVGDYVLVRDLEFATRWFTDPRIIKRVFELSLSLDRYWLFQAVQPGFAQFYAESYNGGEAPPFVLYNIVIIVE